MLTALRVAKRKDAAATKSASAAALRISFHTERPLFPYREPESFTAAQSLAAGPRTLHLFFISDARYTGNFDGESLPWSHPLWTNALTPAQKSKVQSALKLPEEGVPATWWLTEFVSYWPYRNDLGDLYFSRDSDQRTILRIRYTPPWNVTNYVVLLVIGAAAGAIWWFNRRARVRRLSAV
jgi:hypothetical protein